MQPLSGLSLQEVKHLSNQIPVCDRMVQPNAQRHHKPAVFLPVLAPIDDGRKIQVAVRQLDVQRVVGEPRDVRGVKPVGMVFGVQSVLPCFLCLFHIPQGILVKPVIVLTVHGVYHGAGFRVLMKDILGRMDRIIADQFVRLPEIPHPVILAGVEHLGEQIQKVEGKPGARPPGIRSQLCNVDARRHGGGALAILREVAEHALSIVGLFVNDPVVHLHYPRIFRLVRPESPGFFRQRRRTGSRASTIIRVFFFLLACTARSSCPKVKSAHAVDPLLQLAVGDARAQPGGGDKSARPGLLAQGLAGAPGTAAA